MKSYRKSCHIFYSLAIIGHELGTPPKNCSELLSHGGTCTVNVLNSNTTCLPKSLSQTEHVKNSSPDNQHFI